MVSNPSIFQRHRKKTLLLVVAVPCVAMLFVTEAILAWRSPEEWHSTPRAILLREHTPNLDKTLEIPMDKMRDHESLGPGSVHLAIDADGFVEPSRVHDDPT